MVHCLILIRFGRKSTIWKYWLEVVHIQIGFFSCLFISTFAILRPVLLLIIILAFIVMRKVFKYFLILRIGLE